MKKKNNLDEMQEQKLLRIEHNGFWIGFWALAAVITIQSLMGAYLDHIMGEVVVLVIISMYTLFNCLRQGIWDRRLKPNLSSNLLYSLAAALFTGVFFWIRLGKWIEDTRILLLTCLISAALIFALALAVLSLCSAIYKRRRKKLDEE